MNGHLPVPMCAEDDSGMTWHVRRAWPDKTPGDYKLEVLSPGLAGVRAAHLRRGHFELVPEDDPGLPSLRAEARHGEIIAHRPHMRAVIRADDCYIKVFRPGDATVATERCTQMDILLHAGTFAAPRILRSSHDIIVFSTIRGQTLHELGEADGASEDAPFAAAWEKWARDWVALLNAPHESAARSVFGTLPLHTPAVEAVDLWRWANRWLRHTEDVPELSPQRDALRARAEEVSKNLLGTKPDPLVLAHGDLHDKQIIAVDAGSPLGLLDFDETARAEAALDLARLDVRLELHMRRGRMTPARYLTAHTQVLAAAEALRVTAGRLHAYTDAAWLRLACSSLPGRSALAAAVLDERAMS